MFFFLFFHRQICLENGLRAVLISDLKDGEECIMEDTDDEDEEELDEGSEGDGSEEDDEEDVEGTENEQTKRKVAVVLYIFVQK